MGCAGICRASGGNLTAALGAGVRYWLIVFTVAFGFGVVRTLVVAPRVGPLWAVLIEAPLILAVSVAVARWLLRRRPLSMPQRAVMGATAFALLMASEVALAAELGGQSPADWTASLVVLPGSIGLVAQLGFAAIPWALRFRR